MAGAVGVVQVWCEASQARAAPQGCVPLSISSFPVPLVYGHSLLNQSSALNPLFSIFWIAPSFSNVLSC